MPYYRSSNLLIYREKDENLMKLIYILDWWQKKQPDLRYNFDWDNLTNSWILEIQKPNTLMENLEHFLENDLKNFLTEHQDEIKGLILASRGRLPITPFDATIWMAENPDKVPYYRQTQAWIEKKKQEFIDNFKRDIGL